jgi:hypothetical protein
MVGVGVLAYILIAGGSLVYCAARNIKSTAINGSDAP